MSLAEKLSRLIERSEQTDEYWRDIAETDFTRDLHARMKRMSISQAELARRMGTSRPHVTKLLNGGNFTLNTMVKLATALGGTVRIHIADPDTTTIWKDEYSGETLAASQEAAEEVTAKAAKRGARR
ncbi:MAG TPA: XRE family transcriptional regulator [Thermoanaerobaculia bacterium]|nr:XRE family transcriptional regulator [Thermoanaerobaculia bacterium]